MDHRQLLRKYIEHVAANEGTAFLSEMYRFPVRFTDEEWAELVALDTQADTWPIAKSAKYADELQREYVREQLFSPYLHEDDHKGR
jgi:hypothetical protein